MKSLLLKFSLILIILSLTFTTCKKSESTGGKKSENIQKNGIINLDVLWTCGGCQGSSYDIKFTNDTLLYHIGNDITPFGITDTSKFPVSVSVFSKPDTGASNFVIITALKINN